MNIGNYELTEDEFYGKQKIEADLNLCDLTSIPEGFNPTVGGGLYLGSLTSIPDGFNPTVGGGLYLYSLTSIPDGFNPTVGGDLYLYSLTSIPEGFNPTVSGYLYLYSLTSIPEGFNPTVGGYLNLESLTSIPEGFNPTVGGGLYLGSLTSIPEGFNPTIGGGLFLDSLTSIPEGFNPTVGGDLYLDSLTSIPEGFNPTVGGVLDISSVNRLPEGFDPICDGGIYTKGKYSSVRNLPKNYLFSWQDGKYIKADGIFVEVVKRRGKIWWVKRVASDKVFYLVTDGDNYAHGYTLKEAKESLLYKITATAEEFKNLTLDSVLTFKELVACYRAVTGSCEFGVRDFVSRTSFDTSKKYSIKEIVKLTGGEYGNEDFKKFFGGEK